jgi:hypothetical protein
MCQDSQVLTHKDKHNDITTLFNVNYWSLSRCILKVLLIEDFEFANTIFLSDQTNCDTNNAAICTIIKNNKGTNEEYKVRKWCVWRGDYPRVSCTIEAKMSSGGRPIGSKNQRGHSAGGKRKIAGRPGPPESSKNRIRMKLLREFAGCRTSVNLVVCFLRAEWTWQVWASSLYSEERNCACGKSSPKDENGNWSLGNWCPFCTLSNAPVIAILT